MIKYGFQKEHRKGWEDLMNPPSPLQARVSLHGPEQ